MSVGYGGYCVKYGENAEYVLYEYYAFDLNVPGFHNDKRQMDGLIKIDKTTFIEPEIHTRIKRRPGHRKRTIVKRVERPVPYDEYLKSGRIELINSSYCSVISPDGYGRVGLILIYQIYSEYQMNGEIPHRVSIMC